MKRFFDIVLAIIGLLAAAPLMVLIALAIRIDSPGPVIFSQQRLGKGGSLFLIHKFRKFPGNWGSRGSGVTVANDARMTRLGRLLERSKFDELPQLWNILKGDMSFVGPRPESLAFADQFSGELSKVHDYTPGIFGPNQVAYRNESEMYPPDRDPDEFYRSELFPAKARNDIAYFARANLFTDLVWIVRGVWVSLAEAINWKQVIRRRGLHLSYDLCAITGAWLAANLLRFEGLPHGDHMAVLQLGLWLLPLLILPMVVLSGCYRQPVRHFSLSGTVRILSVIIIGYALFAVLAMHFAYRNLSIMVLPLSALVTFTVMLTGRLYYRERWRNRGHAAQGSKGRIRVAIYGAGRRGGALASLIHQGFPGAGVIGFIDDSDSEMRGREIQGRRVLGSERDLTTIHAVHAIDQIWTTFEPDQLKRQRLERWCEQQQVKLIVLPEAEIFRSLRLRAEPAPLEQVSECPLEVIQTPSSKHAASGGV